MEQTRIVRDVQCVTGWRVPDTPFDGVQLSRLLSAAEVKPSAKAIRFTCFDGTYSESLTLQQARREDVLVALRMQDKPLTHAHGGPVRLGEMALRHHGHPRGTARLLGGARL